MKGLFVVFEGLTTSGKKTQIKLLTDKLREQERDVVNISFPSYGTQVGDLIKDWLAKRYIIDPKSMALLYAADRAQYQNRIEEWLKKNWIVISDRYCYSNIAYQSAMGLGRKWLIEIERPIIKPDIVFFIDIPERVAEQRKAKQIGLGKFLGIEEKKKQETIGERIRREFLNLARNPPYKRKWFIIDGTKEVTYIQDQIWNIIKNELS